MASRPAKRQRTGASQYPSPEFGHVHQTPIPLPATYLAAMGKFPATPVPPKPVETPVPVPDLSRFTSSTQRRQEGSLPPQAVKGSTSRPQPYPSPARSSSPYQALARPTTVYQPAPSPSPSPRVYSIPGTVGTVSDLYSQSPPPNRLIVSQMVSDMGPDVISELLCEFMTNIPVIQSTIMKKYAEVLDAARKAREAAEEATRKAQEKSAAAAQKREQAKIRKAQTQVVSFENYSNKAFNMLNKDHGNSSYSNEHAAGLRASSSIEKMFRTMVDKMDQPTTWGTRFNAIETMREIFDHLCGANPGIVPRACRNDMYDWDREFMRGFNKLTAPEMSILAISSNGKWLRSFEGTVAELKKYCIEGSLPGALQRLQSYVDPGSGPAAAVDDPLQV